MTYTRLKPYAQIKCVNIVTEIIKIEVGPIRIS